MKAHKIEILITDFEDYGVDEFKTIIEQSRHLDGIVLNSKTIDIGEWHDDHPLNGGIEAAKKWIILNE